MTAVPVAFRSNEGKYKFLGTTQLVNAYAEQMGSDGKGKMAVLPSEGLVQFSDTDAGPFRGMIYMPDLEKLYTIHSSSAYRITSAGTATRIGTVPGVDQVDLSRNQKADPQVTIQTDSGNQVIESDSLSYVTDTDLPSGAVSQCNATNRTIYGFDDRTYYYSGINDTKTLTALGYSTFDSQAGKLLKVYSDRGELFGFCNSWTDIHPKTASADEPFVYQTTIPRGIIAAIVEIKNDEATILTGEGKFQQSDAIPIGSESYFIQLACVGDQYTLLVNGEEIDSATSSAFSERRRRFAGGCVRSRRGRDPLRRFQGKCAVVVYRRSETGFLRSRWNRTSSRRNPVSI